LKKNGRGDERGEKPTVRGKTQDSARLEKIHKLNTVAASAQGKFRLISRNKEIECQREMKKGRGKGGRNALFGT